MSRYFRLPFVDWPKLYPNQTPICDNTDQLRKGFGTPDDMAFVAHQLERVHELEMNYERAALDALEVLRDGIKDSETRRKQYNVALNTFNCKSRSLLIRLIMF